MPTCTTASSRTWWSNTNDLKCPPRCSGKTSCGTQRPFRALSGTHVLLAAAPTTPSCFCRRQRSSLLQRKYYFGFCKSGRAAAPPDLLFHGRGRYGKWHRLLLACGQSAEGELAFCGKESRNVPPGAMSFRYQMPLPAMTPLVKRQLRKIRRFSGVAIKNNISSNYGAAHAEQF